MTQKAARRVATCSFYAGTLAIVCAGWMVSRALGIALGGIFAICIALGLQWDADRRDAGKP